MTGLGYTADELIELLTPYFVLRGAGSWTWGEWTSTDWDGDAKNADGTLDLSALFGIPAGVKAVSLALSIKDETANVYGMLGTDLAGIGAGVQCHTQVANIIIDVCGIVPCDANGDIYWKQGGELDNVYITINGYLS